jgi:hypothetical protein
MTTPAHIASARHLAGLPRAQPAPRAMKACGLRLLIDGRYPAVRIVDAHASGFRNEIEAGLFGRHLIGRWRNVNDSYFYGSLHFAVLPGETMLDGYYTGFLSDSQVVAERWRWVRVEPQSAEGVDVNTVVLGEPRRIYDAIVGRSPFDAPIPLEKLTENP